ncbi:hypothetical protein Ciccas_008137, partial [Cichlidogyrus casuarinus]
RFEVINVTKEDYEFEWQCQDCDEQARRRCREKVLSVLPQRGVIEAGKKITVKIDHTAEEIGTMESFWSLVVAQHQLQLPFLLVFHCQEPQVSFDKCHVSFPLMLVGHTLSRELILINHDRERSFKFTVDAQSLYGPSAVDKVTIQPMTGTIEPDQRLPLTVAFTARGERQVNINALCHIDGKTCPLNVNIKASCHAMSISVWLDSPLARDVQNPREVQQVLPYCEGNSPYEAVVRVSKRAITSPDLRHLFQSVDFGVIEYGEQSLCRVSVINHGQLDLEYHWLLGPAKVSRVEAGPADSDALTKPDMDLIDRYVQSGNPVISVSPQSGTIDSGKKVTFTLRFAPSAPKGTKSLEASRASKPVKLDNLVAAFLGIRDGPVYAFSLFGSTSKPKLHLSTELISFGRVFVHRTGLNQARLPLVLSNCDQDKSITVEAVTMLEDSPFSHPFTAIVLKPGEKTEILISFIPTCSKNYKKTLQFEVNGLARYGVSLEGTGIALELQVEKCLAEIVSSDNLRSMKRSTDPKFKALGRGVDLGALKVGQCSRAIVQVINPTKLDLFLHSLSVMPGSKSLQFDPEVLSWRVMNKSLSNPLEGTLISGKGGKIMIEITFQPTARMAPFTEQLVGQFSVVYDAEIMRNCPLEECNPNSGSTVPLCMLKGLCQGAEFRFDTAQVSFGAVVLGSQLTKRLLLINSGDVGARFQWKAQSLQPQLSISPMQGYSTPGQQTVFDVTLKPSQLAPDIRIEVCLPLYAPVHGSVI